MKRFLKLLLWTAGIIAVLIGLVAAFVQFSGLPAFDPPKLSPLKIEYTPERIEKGAKIASMVCVVCHTGADGKVSGKYVSDLPEAFGKIYSRNITNDPTVGIGKWRDEELYHFLRTGVRYDGTYIPPYMPKFISMADEDLYSIIAWLRSEDPRVAASKEEPPPTEPSFLSKMLSRTVMGPFKAPSNPILLPDTTNAVVEGKYLANAVYGCFHCHSADFKTNNNLEPEKSAGFYGGGNQLLNMEKEVVHSLNLTPDPESGIGKYTEAQFVEVLRTGRKLDGNLVRYPMLPHPGLSDRELKAIYAYLRTVPPIRNQW